MNRALAYNLVPRVGSINDYNVNISNGQLIGELNDSFPIALDQVKNLAPHFKGASDHQTITNVFNWVCKNLRYKKDGITQRIKLPNELIRTGVADCKSLSLFVAALLNACGIPVRLRYVSYKKDDPTPGHVYVVTHLGAIDPTLGLERGADKLFKQVPYFYKYDFDMNMHRIGNLPRYASNKPVNGWFQDMYNKGKNWAFEQAKKENEKPTGNTIVLKPARAAFLWLLERNHLNWAKGLNVLMLRDADRLKRKWLGLGGDFTNLRKAIEKGRTKATGVYGVAEGAVAAAGGAAAGGASAANPATIAAYLTTAAAVITSLASIIDEGQKAFGKNQTNTGGQTQTTTGPTTTTTTTNTPGTTAPMMGSMSILPLLLIGGGLFYGLSN